MVLITGFSATLIAYLALSLLMVHGWRRQRQGRVLIMAAAASAVWAATCLAIAGLAITTGGTVAVEVVNGLRIALWIWVCHEVLGILLPEPTAARRPLGRTLLHAAAALLVIKTVSSGMWLAFPDSVALGQLTYAAGLGLAVFGLVFVETIYKSADSSRRWAVKHLLIGLGGIFAFELFCYADALLLRQLSDLTQAGQALVAILAVPLVAVATARIRDFKINIQVSRDAVLHTSALLASGVYLLAVAAAGFLIRQLGFGWGPALQMIFLIGAGLLLIVLLSSGQVRDRGRHLITRSFFSFAYDYRKEWQRLVATVNDDQQGLSLHQRLVKAAADPLDCSSGLLYLRRRDDSYRRIAEWNWTTARLPAELPQALVKEATAERPAVDLREAGNKAPESFDEAWILLFLFARGRALGAVILGRPRVSRALTWEDYELLDTLAAQLGSYLAEEQVTAALAEARRFERVSKNFSFVAHDLKNIVSQLSLHLQQAKRHGDKPEFIADTLLTVADSVDKMKAMLLRLKSADGEAATSAIDLNRTVADIARRKNTADRPLAIALPDESLWVEVEPMAFATVVEQLIDNAHEAGGRVKLAVTADETEATAILDISDDGPGMSQAFIDDHLFQPFQSTKQTGFGIGMYQSREWIERWGGKIEILSQPQEGTTVIIRLPTTQASPASRKYVQSGHESITPRQ